MNAQKNTVPEDFSAHVAAFRAHRITIRAANDYRAWEGVAGFGTVGQAYHNLEGAFLRDRLNNLLAVYKSVLETPAQKTDVSKPE